MNKINDVTDEQLKKYASLQVITLPRKHEEMVEEKIAHYMRVQQKTKLKMRKQRFIPFVLHKELNGGMSEKEEEGERSGNVKNVVIINE